MSITRDNAADIVRKTMDTVVDWRNQVVRELAGYMKTSEYVAEGIVDDHKECDLQMISNVASYDAPYKIMEDYVASVGFADAQEAASIAVGTSHVFRALGDARNAEASLVFGAYARDHLIHGGRVIWI